MRKTEHFIFGVQFFLCCPCLVSAFTVFQGRVQTGMHYLHHTMSCSRFFSLAIPPLFHSGTSQSGNRVNWTTTLASQMPGIESQEIWASSPGLSPYATHVTFRFQYVAHMHKKFDVCEMESDWKCIKLQWMESNVKFTDHVKQNLCCTTSIMLRSLGEIAGTYLVCRF